MFGHRTPRETPNMPDIKRGTPLPDFILTRRLLTSKTTLEYHHSLPPPGKDQALPSTYQQYVPPLDCGLRPSPSQPSCRGFAERPGRYVWMLACPRYKQKLIAVIRSSGRAPGYHGQPNRFLYQHDRAKWVCP